jgi:hypothetical protein
VGEARFRYATTPRRGLSGGSEALLARSKLFHQATEIAEIVPAQREGYILAADRAWHAAGT